jgi:hypothetical protein
MPNYKRHTCMSLPMQSLRVCSHCRFCFIQLCIKGTKSHFKTPNTLWASCINLSCKISHISKNSKSALLLFALSVPNSSTVHIHHFILTTEESFHFTHQMYSTFTVVFAGREGYIWRGSWQVLTPKSSTI